MLLNGSAVQVIEEEEDELVLSKAGCFLVPCHAAVLLLRIQSLLVTAIYQLV
jgi:hypothetical protein